MNICFCFVIFNNFGVAHSRKNQTTFKEENIFIFFTVFLCDKSLRVIQEKNSGNLYSNSTEIQLDNLFQIRSRIIDLVNLMQDSLNAITSV